MEVTVVFPKSPIVEANVFSAKVVTVVEFRAASFEEGEVTFIAGFTAFSSDLGLVSVFVLSTGVSCSCVKDFMV